MFKRSNLSTQPDLFGNIFHVAGQSKAVLLADEGKWWNLFRQHIIQHIDEESFRVLFCEDNGRPNASVRVLVGMMILKEAFGLSDEQLYERASFDMTFMLALGLSNVHDQLPTLRTYYNFCRRLREYEQRTGHDLIAEQFAKLTEGQIKRFKVDATEVRMDSKLFCSNIRRHSMYTLCVEVLQNYFKSLSEAHRAQIKNSTRRYLEQLLAKTPDQHTWHKTSAQIRSSLRTLGQICAYLLHRFKHSRAGQYDLLERFFHEHFELKSAEDQGSPPAEQSAEQPEEQPEAEQPDEQTPEVECKKNESGSVLQSVHDPDATYRCKSSGSQQQQVRGYVANITETCKPDQLNLITDVMVTPASTPDCEFFAKAIQQTEQTSAQQVRKVFTDGAYHSAPNQEFISQQGRSTQWYRTAIQGQSIQYAFEWIEQGQKLRVTHLPTGQVYIALRTKSRQEKYRIQVSEGNYRYFLREQIDNYFLRQQIQHDARHTRKRRANVESTIHHVFCTLNGNKSKYRGEGRNKLFVYLRAIYVNFWRIIKWITRGLQPPKTEEKSENAEEKADFLTFPALYALQCLTWVSSATGILSLQMATKGQILFGCQRTFLSNRLKITFLFPWPDRVVPGRAGCMSFDH